MANTAQFYNIGYCGYIRSNRRWQKNSILAHQYDMYQYISTPLDYVFLEKLLLPHQTVKCPCEVP